MPVAVAMSGGVDSTTAALLLKKSGHQVVGFHMVIHEGSAKTWLLAQRAARQVGVPIHMVDLSRQFRDLVVEPFVRAYSMGCTPSPCPICNRFIKMRLLFERARALGCDRLATGHYARIEKGTDEYLLLRGVDKTKDQSYFLFMMTQEILRRTVFPLGRLTKEYVRQFLRSQGLTISESEESQELCFIPHGDYQEVLRRGGVAAEPGPIVDMTGKVLGTHKGITRYTVGQRRGIGISAARPLYVVRIDAGTNRIVVGTRDETFVSTLKIRGFNAITVREPGAGDSFRCKIRSTARPVPATVTHRDDTTIELSFHEPQSGVAPGQAAVLYSEDMVIGGGWIDR
ncbi:MAG: tRNA 2-thiouridine(34) synthase MnmA [Deltaproteobacteria bacterium]|nr:tRNA 2-thiouridine(34) synthase MnmA [Deltaproteobacteria bacterium]